MMGYEAPNLLQILSSQPLKLPELRIMAFGRWGCKAHLNNRAKQFAASWNTLVPSNFTYLQFWLPLIFAPRIQKFLSL